MYAVPPPWGRKLVWVFQVGGRGHGALRVGAVYMRAGWGFSAGADHARTILPCYPSGRAAGGAGGVPGACDAAGVLGEQCVTVAVAVTYKEGRSMLKSDAAPQQPFQVCCSP